MDRGLAHTRLTLAKWLNHRASDSDRLLTADLKGVTRLRAAVSFCIAAGADDSLIPLVLTPALLRRGEGFAECVLAS